MERNAFNAIEGNPLKVDASVISHRIGVPTSYKPRSFMESLSAAGFMDTEGFTVIPSGSGSYGYALSTGESKTTSLGGGISLSAEFEVVTVGVLVGGSLGFAYDYEYSLTTGTEVTTAAAIPYLPLSVADSLYKVTRDFFQPALIVYFFRAFKSV